MQVSGFKNRAGIWCLLFTAVLFIVSAGVWADDFELVSGGIGDKGFTSSGGEFVLKGTIEPGYGDVSDGKGYFVNSGVLPMNMGCEVNLTDMLVIAEAWLDTSGNSPADVDGNGRVDIADFSHVAWWWYRTCPADWEVK